MKLESQETEIERSSTFATKSFAIGNVRIIMDILRSKMYPDPVKTICQEIGSNARDAHREAGHNDPIVIKLPTYIDPVFYIRDFGNGITPDRMANVFIQYGNSTKREDDTQTGGFGLGAKSPFAYSDLFSIVTITEESGLKKKREYVAFIDETKIGSMSLAKEEDTDERTGTTIIIKPKPGDERKFKDKVSRVFRYWSVKPAITSDDDFSFSPVNYKLTYKNDAGELKAGVQDDEDKYPMAIIDEIPYKLLDFPFTDDTVMFKEKPIRLFFKTGELAVTANREGIDTQEWVIKAINNRFLEFKQFLEKDIRNQIKECKNAWEAWIVAKQFQEYHIKDAEWNNLKLNGQINIESKYVDTYVEYTYQSYYNRVQPSRPKPHEKYRIDIGKNVRLVEFNKGTNVKRAKLMPLFKAGAEKIICVRFKTDTTTGIITKPAEWDSFAPLKAEELVSEQTGTGGGGTGGVKVPKSKVISSQPKTEWTEAEIDLETGEAIYVLVNGTDFIDPVTKKYFDIDSIRRISRDLGKDVLLITLLRRYEEKVGPDWIPLSTYVTGKIKDFSPTSILNSYETTKSPEQQFCAKLLSHLLKNVENIDVKDSTAYKYLTSYVSAIVHKNNITQRDLVSLAKWLAIPVTVKTISFCELYEQFLEEYPLLSTNPYFYDKEDIEAYAKDFISYINYRNAINKLIVKE